jgi:hypothetical protein
VLDSAELAVRAPKIRVELTVREAQALSSWCANLRAGPTDWEESGGDAKAVERAERKIDAALEKAEPAEGGRT